MQNSVCEGLISIEKGHENLKVHLAIYSYSVCVEVYLCHSFINPFCKKVLAEQCYVRVKPVTPVVLTEEDEVPEANGIKHKLTKF